MDEKTKLMKVKMENIRNDPHPKNKRFFENLRTWDDETLLAGLRMMESACELSQISLEKDVELNRDLEWFQLNVLFYQEEIKRRGIYE